MKDMIDQMEMEVIDIHKAKEQKSVRDFLTRFDLQYEEDLEYTIVLRRDGEIVGTGSFKDEVLRNIAVDEQMQGTGLTSTIITELMREQARRGKMHYFIFTKPDKAQMFTSLGFKEIARVEPYVALLETGLGSVATYCDTVKKEVDHLKGNRAALVVNCNPFTKGHRALIQKAAEENDAVIVFVVSEDRSLFPFQDRITLVREGVADLTNVVVVPSGKYIISSATFPTYFIRDEDKVAAQTLLDITLFAEQIAPRLGIVSRYVGEEPYCPVTRAYNEAMLKVFPKHGLSIQVIKRVEADGEIISASKVREAIRRDDWELIRSLVPENTFAYLKHPETQQIIEKIKHTDSRH